MTNAIGTNVTSGYLSRDQTIDSHSKKLEVLSEKKVSNQAQHNNSAIIHMSKRDLVRPTGVLSDRDREDIVVVQNEIAEYSSGPILRADNLSGLVHNSFEE